VLKHLRSSEDWSEKNLPQKGFTLVELLVVIVILGILAAVVVFAVSGSTSKAKDSACKSELSSLQTAVEAYNASTGSYPTAMSQLTTGSSKFLRSTPTLYGLSSANDGSLVLTSTGTSQGCATPT
jgi:prepilin-type N-terminal cleavage/methylation domain-containing protein